MAAVTAQGAIATAARASAGFGRPGLGSAARKGFASSIPSRA